MKRFSALAREPFFVLLRYNTKNYALPKSLWHIIGIPSIDNIMYNF